MAVILLNHPSSGGLLPTPPPTSHLLPYSALYTPSTPYLQSTHHTLTKWKGSSSNLSRNRSPSTSPPRQSHKKHKTSDVKERYSGAAFFTASPAPQSLPFPTFLLPAATGNNKDIISQQYSSSSSSSVVTGSICFTVTKGAATDDDDDDDHGGSNLGRRLQYPRDLLLTLSKSAPTSLPPQLHCSKLRELDNRRW